MDQNQAPIVDALAAIEKRPPVGFGAPGHSRGAALPTGMRRLLGKRVFQADVLTPKGLDDRTESKAALQRAHEIAAAAWQADFCRFSTGGSTQSLHAALAAVARPGDTVLLAANAHKAEHAHALAAGLNPVVVPVQVDQAWDVEHGVSPDALQAALAAHPQARAALVVSPTYHGVTSDIAALADVCHRRSVPLIVDAAWGGAFAFCEALPHDALTKGADIAVYSAHKTMGALAQGSVIVARGGHADLQRLWMAYELFQTTSPSVPILASLDATRRDHALDGERLWTAVLARADALRKGLAAVEGLRVLNEGDLSPGAELDRTKVLVDVSTLGVSGYAADDWLYANHRVSVGLSDARHLSVVVSLGTTRRDVSALLRGVRALAVGLAADPGMLPRAAATPSVATLSVEMAMPGPDAMFAPAEAVRYEEAAGRIAAEIIAPAPPGVPRLVPGQLITERHVAWLVANRDAGAFILDPVDPSGQRVRVVADRL